MSDDPRLQQLLDQLLETEATPEEVCAACPELLDTVRERWQQMRRVRAELEAFFPSPTEASTSPAEEVPLPQIPGYEVEVVLGRGGMGVVFKARHLTLDRVVALKMMLAGTYAGPEELARFRREATAVAALRHPNIVPVHDAGEVGGRPYFTMEFVEGGTLASSLAGKPQNPRRAAELVATLATAVQFAHQSGFIHRDLKPANILLTPDGHPKITDFGLVRSIEADPEFTRSGAPLGTPGYMAPEQALGRAGDVGPAADIYALGAILYQMLTGRPPFEGQSGCEIIQKVVAEEPVPPSRLYSGVPRDLETICLKCLQKNPAQRYGSALSLADDLHRFLDGKPVLARPVGLFERAVKWFRRQRAVALLGGTLLVLLVAAAGIGFWWHQQEKERQAVKEQREGQARDALRTALRRADDFKGEERWQEGLDVLTAAASHLDEADSPQLQEQLRQARADFQFAADLQRTREDYPLLPDGTIDYPQRAREFQQAFDRAGFSFDEDAETVAERIRTSAIREPIVAALDHRAVLAFLLNDKPAIERFLRIIQLADPGSPWQIRFRDSRNWGKREQLEELAATAFTDSPAPPEHQLALLALKLRVRGAWPQSAQLLGEACRRQPRNVFFHREMGFALFLQKRYLEGAGYYRVALSLRPENAVAYEGLARCLARAGQVEDALAAYRRAVVLAPKRPSLHTSLVAALAEAGYWNEAEEANTDALASDSGNFQAPYRLAEMLSVHGKLEEAERLCRKAIEIAPTNSLGHSFLGAVCLQRGRHEETATAFRKWRELKGANFAADFHLARELTAAGHLAEAIAVVQEGVAREPSTLWYSLELGRLLRADRKVEEAGDVFLKIATLHPREGETWEGLASVRLEQGRFADAREATERLLTLPPPSQAARQAQQRQLALCDSLVASAADVPAILAGKERPAKASAQLALAEWCLKYRRRTATAAGFYTTAFSVEPSLANDLEVANRMDAACAAALAGCGIGADVADLDGERRAGLRKQALDWLTAEYDAWAQRHRVGKPEDWTVAAKAVRSWQGNKDLAGVRDEQALAKFPAGERQAWQALWAKVATLAARDPAVQFDQARAHVVRGEWARAATCYAEGFELEPTENGDLWFEYAAVQLLAGDRPGYRKACAHLAAQWQPNGKVRAYLVARACTLASESIDVTQPLLRSRQEMAPSETEYWALTQQGAWEVRLGHPKEGVTYLERSLVADGRPGRAVLNWLWLALAHQKMGNPSEARRWLKKAADWLDQQGGQMPVETREMGSHRHNWLEAHVLRQEIETRLR
jgi:serine/threonine-protein kinase